MRAGARGLVGPGVLFGLALTAGPASLFGLAVANVVADQGLTGLDAPVTRFVAAHRSAVVTHLMRILTDLGSANVTIGLAVIVVGILLLRVRDLFSAAFLAILVAAGDLSYVVIKLLVHRARPAGALINLSTYSFPSGHSVGTTTLFVGLAWIVSRRLRSWGAKAALWAGAVLLVVLVDVTRLYLGVHYASDVIGGDLLGAAWVALCATALVAWERLAAD